MFVCIAYSGDMLRDDIKSPDIISDIVSDDMMMPSNQWQMDNEPSACCKGFRKYLNPPSLKPSTMVFKKI